MSRETEKILTEKPRPYWHVDMKWITGFLLLISLSVSILLFNFSKLMAPEVAVDMATLAVATAFSGGDLDKTSDLEEAKKKTPLDAEGKFRPIPQNPEVFVTKDDLDTLSPREIRLKIFRQVVEPIYYRGSDSKASISGISDDKEAAQKLGLLAFLTEKNHKKIVSFFQISVILTAAILALFVFFSGGAGRFTNPGLIFILVGAPGIFFSMILQGPKNKSAEPVQQAKNIVQMASGIMKIIGPQISGIVMKPYLYLALTGLGLIAGAIVYKVVRRIRK